MDAALVSIPEGAEYLATMSTPALVDAHVRAMILHYARQTTIAERARHERVIAELRSRGVLD